MSTLKTTRYGDESGNYSLVNVYVIMFYRIMELEEALKNIADLRMDDIPQNIYEDDLNNISNYARNILNK